MQCGSREERTMCGWRGLMTVCPSLIHDVSNKANGDSVLRGCKPPVLGTVWVKWSDCSLGRPRLHGEQAESAHFLENVSLQGCVLLLSPVVLGCPQGFLVGPMPSIFWCWVSKTFIYLFIFGSAVSLLLHGLFSRCGNRWLLLLVGFSNCGTRAQQLWFSGSGAQVQQLWGMGLVALWHVGSFPIRDQTSVSYVGRCILYHWVTMEDPGCWCWCWFWCW